ncbi:MAG: serine/threonine protein kinase, partial [Symploca sp. SIO2D2]|nr:serine/threonine protein kinase [Symploca sp. SIO2D2]
MSYCINPVCSQPKNPPQADICQTCGEQLLLHERYRVLKPLSRGKFGATFLAQDHSLPNHPLCVIKQLRPATTESRILEMAEVLFEREA